MSSKSVYAFKENVHSFVNHFGLEKCGFFTLTFPDEVKCVFEASKRFNSLRTGYLSKIILGYIGVYERHKTGVIHFHFIVALKQNILFEIKKGVQVNYDFKAVRRRNYKTAPKALRLLWKELRENLPKYGFGRHQLEPIKSDKGISKYLSKYLIKGIAERKEQDKGFRLVRSTSGKKAQIWRKASTQFSWVGGTSEQWRKALKNYIEERASIARYRLSKQYRFYEKFLHELQKLSLMNQENYGEIMKNIYGSNWCYKNKDRIFEQWIKDEDRPVREIYYYEMGIGDYVRVIYDSELCEIYD